MAHGFRQHAHHAFSAGFFGEDFDFDVRLVLGYAPFGGSDVGEVLRTIDDVKDGDHDHWYTAWAQLGDSVRAHAEESAAAGHTRSAGAAYLRAANYYAMGINTAEELDDDERLMRAYRAHRAAWEAFVDHAPFPAERVAVPYEDTTLPGYFFRTPGDGPHPTLVLVNGSDGSISSMWATGGLGGLQRGYNVFMFDGPGQQSMLFERDVPFRSDWEAVLTPVVDALIARDDVDAEQLVAYGISQSGYWLPRALAFEHRFRAAVADPGVVDVSESWFSHIPKNEVALIHNGEKDKFNHTMETAMKFSPAISRLWKFRARPYGQQSPYDTMVEMLKYRLSDEDAAQITTPLLVTSPEKEQFWPGQSERLVNAVAGATLVPFTSDEGADYHCQPLARLLTDERMFDWLDTQLGR